MVLTLIETRSYGCEFVCGHRRQVMAYRPLLLGGANPGVQILDEVGITETHAAVEHAVSKGVVVVAAAGNENVPFCSSPASRDS